MDSGDGLLLYPSQLAEMFALARAHRSCAAARHVSNQLQLGRFPLLKHNIHQTSVGMYPRVSYLLDRNLIHTLTKC
jgi:hypothetical protein